MANSGLVTIGFLIILGVFYLTNIYVTPQQTQQLLLADSVCNSAIGSIAGALSGDIARECEKIRTIAPIFYQRMNLYIFGLLLIIIGMFMGSSNTKIVEEYIDEPIKKSTPNKKEIRDKIHCESCGKSVSKNAKFCKHCGEKQID